MKIRAGALFPIGLKSLAFKRDPLGYPMTDLLGRTTDNRCIHLSTGATWRAERIDLYLTSERKASDVNESYHEKKHERAGFL